MRLLANLIVALTLVWPVPLAMPTAFAAPVAANSGAMHGVAAHHADHEATPPAHHDIGQMPDCCVGTACFSFALTEGAGVPFDSPRGQPSASEADHLAAISHPPDLPPPRL